MDEDRPLFPPPPRPPGPGGRRRRRWIFAWCAGGAIGFAFLAFLARQIERTSIETRRLVAEGRRTPCTVVSKRSSGGKSKSYYVRLAIEGPPHGPPVERSLPRGVWESVGPGSTSVWYFFPERPFDGVSELERPSKESMSGYYVSLALAGAAVATVLAAVAFLLRRIRLLVSGLELRISADGRLSHRGRSIHVRLPFARTNLIRLRSGALVALATPDLSRRFFPELGDVALDRLLEGVPPSPLLLPGAPREPHPDWERWLRRHHSGFKMGIGVAALLGAGALAGLPFSDHDAGFGTIAAAAGAVAGTLLLAWRRGLARGRRLWRDGAEVHAAVLRTGIVKRQAGYDLGFLRGKEEVRFRASLPRDVPLRDVGTPEEAPIPLRRVVVLVDPDRPRRAAVVPFEIGIGPP